VIQKVLDSDIYATVSVSVSEQIPSESEQIPSESEQIPSESGCLAKLEPV